MTALHPPRRFGVLADGRAVLEYTLKNRHGITVGILDYGGIIRTLRVPDKGGQFDDVVLGFDELSQYEKEQNYFGALIGRVAGRISGGRLNIDGITSQLPLNDSPNHLHGGVQGFDRKLWQADYSDETQSLVLSYESASSEEGYPGTLQVRVTYKLSDDNELSVDYYASTDAATVVNLTQHSYFNLSGDPSNTILDHTLAMNSDQVLELGSTAMPTGRILDITKSRFDFRTAKRVGENDSDGYDNFWVLSGDRKESSDVELAHPESGRILQVATTAPGVQIYTGAAIPSGLSGKGQAQYGPMSGICIEAQVHPDSPNQANFPSILLDENSVFESKTVFRFLVS